MGGRWASGRVVSPQEPEASAAYGRTDPFNAQRPWPECRHRRGSLWRGATLASPPPACSSSLFKIGVGAPGTIVVIDGYRIDEETCSRQLQAVSIPGRIDGRCDLFRRQIGDGNGH
jgi:hypothetical protein